MIKVIKHGNTVHTYKCAKCECIFTASKRDIEIEDITAAPVKTLSDLI